LLYGIQNRKRFKSDESIKILNKAIKMDKSIKNVIDIEKKVDMMVVKAEKKALKIVEDARKTVDTNRDEFETNLVKDRETKITEAEAEIKKQKHDMQRTAESDQKRLITIGNKNSTKAVDYVFRLLKKVD